MVDRWNEIVKDDDIVYYLGDFTLGNIHTFDKFYNRLKGYIYFIKGNHDKRWWYDFGKEESQDRRLGELYLLKLKIPIVLCHYAMRT